jgi:hypothetical protein
MQIDAGSVRRRLSVRPVLVLLVVVAVIAVAFAITRPRPAPAEPVPASPLGTVEPEALVESGFTGRLGGVTYVDWTDEAKAAGFTGRLGA